MRVTLRSVDQDTRNDLLLVNVPQPLRATSWLRVNLGMGRLQRCRLVSQAHRGKHPVILPAMPFGEALALARRMADEAGMTLGLRPTV